MSVAMVAVMLFGGGEVWEMENQKKKRTRHHPKEHSLLSKAYFPLRPPAPPPGVQCSDWAPHADPGADAMQRRGPFAPSPRFADASQGRDYDGGQGPHPHSRPLSSVLSVVWLACIVAEVRRVCGH
jgi:hypothetical protein